MRELCVLSFVLLCGSPLFGEEASLFERRILPIAKSQSASSCTECHFGGVELQDFVAKDEATTFAALRKAGWIDVEKPDDSKLLAFIGRKPEEPDPLLDRVRERELEAFREWIREATRDPKLLATKTDVRVGIEVPVEVVRHARRDRVLSSFLDNVWSEMGRCVHCHSPEKNRGAIGRNGRTKEDVDAISWIVPNDPPGTLRRLVEDGNLDFEDPAASPFITKPAGLAEHGGGPKFVAGSTTHGKFVAFAEDYAAIANGDYETAADLPAPPGELVLPLKQHLRVTDVPEKFGGAVLRVDFFAWNADAKEWSTQRRATMTNRVLPKRLLWGSVVAGTAPPGSDLAASLREHERLPKGVHLAKFYVDRRPREEQLKSPFRGLDELEFVGQREIPDAWQPGKQPPNVFQEIAFPKARD